MRRDSYREWLRRLAYKLELMVYRVLIAAFCNSRILLLTVKFEINESTQFGAEAEF